MVRSLLWTRPKYKDFAIHCAEYRGEPKFGVHWLVRSSLVSSQLHTMALLSCVDSNNKQDWAVFHVCNTVLTSSMLHSWVKCQKTGQKIPSKNLVKLTSVITYACKRFNNFFDMKCLIQWNGNWSYLNQTVNLRVIVREITTSEHLFLEDLSN